MRATLQKKSSFNPSQNRRGNFSSAFFLPVPQAHSYEKKYQFFFQDNAASSGYGGADLETAGQGRRTGDY
jgi:hypothetical protein